MQQDTVLIAVLIAVALLLVGWTLVFLLRNVVVGGQTRTLLLSAPVALDSTATTKITTTMHFQDPHGDGDADHCDEDDDDHSDANNKDHHNGH